MYWDSSDPKVAKAGIQVRTGWTRRAEEAVQEADARLRHRSMVRVVNTRSSWARILSNSPNEHQGERRAKLKPDRLETIKLTH